MQSEEEKNRLRVLSQQNNIPLRVNQPTQPTATPLRVSTPYTPPTPQRPEPTQLERAQSFINAAGAQLGGGLLRAGLRTAPTVARFTPVGLSSYAAGRLGGRDVIGELQQRGEQLAQESERLQAEEMARLPDQSAIRPGKLFGSGIKGVADVAALVAPSVAASKVLQGTQVVQRGLQGGRAARLATRAAESVLSGLPSSAVDVLQQIGRGEKPSAARSLAVGAAVDLGVPFLGETVRVLRDSRVLTRLAETDSAQRVFNYLRRTAPEVEEQVAREAAEDIARTTNPDEVANIVDDLIEQSTPRVPIPEPAPTPTPTPVPTPTPAVQAITDTLARQTDVNQIRQTIQELFPALDENGQTQFAQRIAAANTPEAVEAVLDQADEVSRGLTQAIEEVTPPAVAPSERPIAQAIEQPVTAPTAVAEGPTVTQPATVAPRVAEPTAVTEATRVTEVPGTTSAELQNILPQTSPEEFKSFIKQSVKGNINNEPTVVNEVLSYQANSQSLNNYLRRTKDGKFTEGMTKDLDKAFTQTLEQPTKLYRGIRGDFQDILSGKTKTFVDNGYSSTSLDGIEARSDVYTDGIVLSINAPKGQKVIIPDMYSGSVDTISQFTQQEVILPRGLEYKVNSITRTPDGRNIIIDVDIVKQTQKDVPSIKPTQAAPAPTVPGATAQVFDATTEARIPAEVTNYETIGGQFQRAFVDKDAPLLNYAKQLEKQTGETGLVDQLYYVTGLQRRANSIANSIIQTNPSLREALDGLTNVTKGEFDIYVAARNELANAGKGMKTSRPVTELRELVDRLAPEYSDRFASLNRYYQDWALRMRQAGLIDEQTYRSFISNPDYTRIQRVMDDLAEPPTRGGAGYSLGTPSARQRRKGSLREIQPADITAFDYAQRIQKEIQRNETASTIIDLLRRDNATRKVPASQAARKNTIRRVVNGKTEIWEVPKDIKELANNVTPYQLGVLQKIIAFPQRVFRAGVTGLSAPFTAVNFARDLVSSAVYSRNAAATHLNPVNILTGLKNAAADTLGAELDDPLWNKFLSVAGNTTEYDLFRNLGNAKEASRQLRLGKLGKARNMAGSPIRTLEDLNSITERATRFSNFKGMYESVLKRTNDPNLAMREATLAAWQNSVDFNRSGNVSQVINLLVPYFNASIQGTRLLGRRLVDNPVSTSGKLLGMIGLPLMGATLYNQADEKRKAVYDNISEFEKENNIIIVLPNAKQKEDGTYEGVIKIPLQPGLSNLVNPIRQYTELYAGQVPLPEAQKMLSQFMQAFTGPVETGSIQGFIGGLTPQILKPTLQQVMNKDLFTDREIVPEYIQEQVTAEGKPLKESDKAYRYSSGSARLVGGRLGVSPIRVEKFIKDTTGKVGQYVINAADTILAGKGVIPEEQVGGISVKDDFTRRFVNAQGEYNYKKSEGAKYYDFIKEATKDLTPNEKKAFDTLHPQKTNILGEDIFDENKRIMKYAKAGVYLQFPKVFEAERAIEMEQRKLGNPANPLYDLPADQLTRVLLKATLPPGAKDPELSNLWQQEWYQDFNTKRDQYYSQLQAKMASEGKALPQSDNPYPSPSPQLQQTMNLYSSLPKGTGARSAWIQSNPVLWNQMTNQWAAVDAWENKERVAMGLSPVEAGQQLISQNAMQSYGFKTTSPEYKAAIAALRQIETGIRPLSIVSAAPRRARLARVRVPTTRRTARIRLR